MKLFEWRNLTHARCRGKYMLANVLVLNINVAL